MSTEWYGTRYALMRDGRPAEALPPRSPRSHWQAAGTPGDLFDHLARVTNARVDDLCAGVRAYVEDGVPAAIMWGYLQHGGTGNGVLDLHAALGAVPVAPEQLRHPANMHLIGHALGMALVVFEGDGWVTYGVLENNAPVCRLMWDDVECSQVVPARSRRPALLPPPPPPAVLALPAEPVRVKLRGSTVPGPAAFRAVTAASVSEILRDLPAEDPTLPLRGRWREAVRHLVQAGAVAVKENRPRGAFGHMLALDGLQTDGLQTIEGLEGRETTVAEFAADLVDRLAVPGMPWAEYARQILGTRARRSEAADKIAARMLAELPAGSHIALDFEWDDSLAGMADVNGVDFRDGAIQMVGGLWRRADLLVFRAPADEVADLLVSVDSLTEHEAKLLVLVDKNGTALDGGANPTVNNANNDDETDEPPAVNNGDKIDGWTRKKYMRNDDVLQTHASKGGQWFVSLPNVIAADAGVALRRWSPPAPDVLVVAGAGLHSGRYVRHLVASDAVVWQADGRFIYQDNNTRQLYLTHAVVVPALFKDLRYIADGYAPCVRCNIWRVYDPNERAWRGFPGATVRPDGE